MLNLGVDTKLHGQPNYIYIYQLTISVTTFEYMEGGPDEAREVHSMKYQFVDSNVVAVCLHESDSVSLNGCAGQGKPSRR